MSAAQFRLPDPSHRVTIVGMTGSGKTVYGAWLLSHAPFDQMPYVMVDYKRDELLNSIDRVPEIGLNEVPKHPGLYRVHPHPDDADATDAWFRKVWERGSVGIYIDEGYMAPTKGKGFEGILTQGRSLHIPAITLTQRPSWVSRFVFSEADFHSLFFLNDDRDNATAGAFLPRGAAKREMPEYWSQWYDVKRRALFTMQPAPHPDEIRERISSRLKPRHKIF